MTVNDMIKHVDKIVPNEFDKQTKMKWLSMLDADIYETLLSKYKEFDDISKPVYKDGSETLLAAEAYEDIYTQWLIAHIYLMREETTKYNNTISLYNQIYSEYRAFISRTYTHKSPGKIKKFIAWGDI